MARREGTKPVGIRLSQDEMKALDEQAESEMRSKSNLAKLCFLDGLELRRAGHVRALQSGKKLP